MSSLILSALLALDAAYFGMPWQTYSKCDQISQQSARANSSFDPATNLTTVRLAPVYISGEKGKYYSLHFGASFTYQGKTPTPPSEIDFELRSVVKVRKLKIDLYVVFIVDGETIFLSSNRSAIRNPVPGRRWVGERLVFRMPYDTLLKITNARKFAIKIDALTFDVGKKPVCMLRDFVNAMSNQAGPQYD